MRSTLTIAERCTRPYLGWIELCLHRFHAFANQMRTAAHMQANIVSFGVDPVDIVGAHEVELSAGSYYESRRGGRCRSGIRLSLGAQLS